MVEEGPRQQAIHALRTPATPIRGTRQPAGGERRTPRVNADRARPILWATRRRTGPQWEVAQWQSSRLLIEWLRVRVPPSQLPKPPPRGGFVVLRALTNGSMASPRARSLATEPRDGREVASLRPGGRSLRCVHDAEHADRSPTLLQRGRRSGDHRGGPNRTRERIQDPGGRSARSARGACAPPVRGRIRDRGVSGRPPTRTARW